MLVHFLLHFQLAPLHATRSAAGDAKRMYRFFQEEASLSLSLSLSTHTHTTTTTTTTFPSLKSHVYMSDTSRVVPPFLFLYLFPSFFQLRSSLLVVLVPTQ